MSDASGASMPTNTTNTTTTIPDYARPYVEEMLGGTSALTFQRDDKGGITGFQPYETYGGERTAQFSPLQQQSYEAAGALGTSPQIYAASDMAQRAGLAALNQGAYTGGQFANQYQSTGPYTGDTGTYFRGNPDVAAAYQQNSYGMTPEQFAQQHYQKYGMAEGRQAPGTVGNQYQGTDPYQAGQFQNQFDPSAGAYQNQQYQNQFNAGNAGSYQAGNISAQNTSTGRFIDPTNAQDYMSPYMEQVVAIQQRDAQRQADIAGTQLAAKATQAGALGGWRDAIMRAEAARNLALQKGDIQATGLQAAYQQAQTEFNTDQQRSLQSQIANQGSNLQAQQMGEQSRQYGAGLGLQAAQNAAQCGQAANQLSEQSRQFGSQQGLTAAQAAAQYGQSANQLGEQSRQFGSQQNLQNAQNAAQYGQAAQQLGVQDRQFASQQAMQNAGNFAQYGQAAQQLGEQSRQFGAGLGIQGLQTGLSAAGTLGTLGGQQYAQDQGALQTQNTLGVQQQQQMQNILTQQYNDFLNQQKYPYQQMGYMSDMLRGLPMSNTTQQIYGQPASSTSQLAGLAATAYGASKMAKGGRVKAKGGLQELAMSRMEAA